MAEPIREQPDVETSSAGYAARFAGEAGRYMLGVQKDAVLDMLADLPPGATVLDVGGGHGQLARPLAERAFRVTVAGSTPDCVTRVGAGPADNPIGFVATDLLALPFEDRGMDAVVSVRLVSHMEAWQSLIAELCRVAARSVVIDYPALESVNALSLLTFPLKRAIEGNTRTYRSFWTSELRQAFEANGFRPVRSVRQFALPMVAHRMMKGAAPSRWAEAGLRMAGITGLVGNPVILRADRI